MMMSHRPSATPYSSLPSQPDLHALPQGVPFGPWQSLYRAAPGAEIPATYLPGLYRYHPGQGQGQGKGPMNGFGQPMGYVPGVTLVGGLGAPVTFASFGQTPSKAKLLGGAIAGAAVSGAIGASYAWMITKTDNPVRNTGLFTAGLTLMSGLMALLVMNGNNGNGAAAAAPAS